MTLDPEQAPLPSYEPTQRKLDIIAPKEKSGWEPKIQLDQGLEATVE